MWGKCICPPVLGAPLQTLTRLPDSVIPGLICNGTYKIALSRCKDVEIGRVVARLVWHFQEQEAEQPGMNPSHLFFLIFPLA